MVPSADESRAAIVEAADRLLRAEGVHAVTTRAVAAAAGVQAPTIYRLFGDKDGLLDALAERVMAAFVVEKASATTADLDPVDELRASWHRTVEFGLANPELYALIALPGRATRSPAAAAGVELLRERIGRLAAAGRLRVDEDRALEMIRAAGTGTIVALLERPAAERDHGLPDAMLEAVTDAILVAEPVPGGANGVAGPDVTAVAVTFASVLPDLPGLTDAERGLMVEWLDRSLRRRRPSVTGGPARRRGRR